MNEKDIIATFRIEDCTRCKNECAASCPVYRHYGARHPRELAHLFLGGAGAAHPLVWECVTCGACTEACPFKVPFADFVRALRVGRSDYRPAFGGLVHAYQRRQAAGMKAAAAKARAAWIDKSLDVNRGSDVALFAGCLPLHLTGFREVLPHLNLFLRPARGVLLFIEHRSHFLPMNRRPLRRFFCYGLRVFFFHGHVYHPFLL